MRGHSVFIILSIIVVGVLNPVRLLAQPTVRATDQELKSGIEFAIRLLKLGSRQQLAEIDFKQIIDLPISSIPVLTQQLNAVPAGISDRPLFDLLAIKVGLHEGQLSKADLSGAIDALLARAAVAKNYELQDKIFVLSGSAIKNERIKDGISKMKANLVRLSGQGVTGTGQTPASSNSVATGTLGVNQGLPLTEFQLAENSRGIQGWVAKRSAGIELHQTQQAKLYYPGSMTVGGVILDLGETPPRICYQLKTKNCALLLGEFDNRQVYQRHLCTVRLVDGKPVLNYDISVSFPRSTTQGGFVFRRNETVIQAVGVLIPDVKVPPQDDPAASQWSVLIRVEKNGRDLDPGELANIKPQALDADAVILMQTQSGEVPASARILWLEIKDDGSLAIARH